MRPARVRVGALIRREGSMGFGYNNQNNYGNYAPYAGVGALPGQLSLGDIMRRVYLWLAAGLLIGFGVSYLMAGIRLSPIVYLLAIVGYLVVAFAFYPIVQRASVAVGSALYLAFTALFGVLISSIWAVYGSGPIYSAFVTTAAMFGIMAILGFTTRLDLSRMGSILFMALIGLLIVSLVNIFLGSGLLFWLISLGGVVIFSGLTAYDTQWIKRNAASLAYSGGGQAVGRFALVAAFHLFMDFVNLFLFILRLFGYAGRR